MDIKKQLLQGKTLDQFLTKTELIKFKREQYAKLREQRKSEGFKHYVELEMWSLLNVQDINYILNNDPILQSLKKKNTALYPSTSSRVYPSFYAHTDGSIRIDNDKILDFIKTGKFPISIILKDILKPSATPPSPAVTSPSLDQWSPGITGSGIRTILSDSLLYGATFTRSPFSTPNPSPQSVPETIEEMALDSIMNLYRRYEQDEFRDDPILQQLISMYGEPDEDEVSENMTWLDLPYISFNMYVDAMRQVYTTTTPQSALERLDAIIKGRDLNTFTNGVGINTVSGKLKVSELDKVKEEVDKTLETTEEGFAKELIKKGVENMEINYQLTKLELSTPTFTEYGIRALNYLLDILTNRNEFIGSHVYYNKSCGMHVNIRFDRSEYSTPRQNNMMNIIRGYLPHLNNITPDHRKYASYNTYTSVSYSKGSGVNFGKNDYIEFRFPNMTKDPHSILMWVHLLHDLVEHAKANSNKTITGNSGALETMENILNYKPPVSILSIIKNPLVIDWYIKRMFHLNQVAKIDNVATLNTNNLFNPVIAKPKAKVKLKTKPKPKPKIEAKSNKQDFVSKNKISVKNVKSFKSR